MATSYDINPPTFYSYSCIPLLFFLEPCSNMVYWFILRSIHILSTYELSTPLLVN
ncbi:hypothetical protein BDQ12DRAFT_686452 [Crucibulum laeve]|uniref:Uncharacterized protein n=1 Tax=Crucibulum laeve TaxID=68775 RepID=A0A5C3LUV5_9AGAR|nr:hypothetical protein BDQ12DRAFT_686452 [Crucibulum laeve]